MRKKEFIKLLEQQKRADSNDVCNIFRRFIVESKQLAKKDQTFLKKITIFFKHEKNNVQKILNDNIGLIIDKMGNENFWQFSFLYMEYDEFSKEPKNFVNVYEMIDRRMKKSLENKEKVNYAEYACKNNLVSMYVKSLLKQDSVDNIKELIDLASYPLVFEIMERVKGNNIELDQYINKKIKEGGFSKVYEIGDKILKIGGRVSEKIPYNRRILQPLLRTKLEWNWDIYRNIREGRNSRM